MDRWWNAGNTAVEALELVDGSSPRLGVGVAVLGFHAIAKSALDPLAETTLVDQLALQSAIEKADYEPVLEAVHTATCDALGHEAAAKYGELVVNDLRQRTSDSARRLYQTLVNKGVPSPRAVVRVASVAGVPIEYLGRYATIASNAGLDALSVADHADRALMEFASRRSALEPELVRKDDEGRQRQRHRAAEPWDEAEHPRDEIGRFAQVQAGDEERRERAARRARRKQRKSRREAQREAAVQQSVKREVVDGKAKLVVVEQGKAKQQVIAQGEAKQQVVERQRGSSDKGVFGLDMIPLDEVPMAEESGAPITVDNYLFVVEPDTFSGIAYDEDQIGRAVTIAAAMYRNQSRDAYIRVRRFSPGELPILGSVEAQKPGKAGIKIDGYALGYEPFYEGRSESSAGPYVTVGNPLQVLEDSYWVDERTNYFGVPVKVKFVDSILEGTAKDWTGGKSDEEGRQRQRQRQIKWDESEHPRDEIGRFAEVAETEAEIADRKARRERRKRRKQRAAQRAVQAQRVTERTSEAPKQVVREQGKAKQVVREQAAAKQVVREQGRAKAVARQKEAGSPKAQTLMQFVSGFSGGYQLKAVPTASLTAAGIGPELYQRDVSFSELFDELVDAANRNSPESVAADKAVYKRYGDEIRSGYLSADVAYAMHELHSATVAMLSSGEFEDRHGTQGATGDIRLTMVDDIEQAFGIMAARAARFVGRDSTVSQIPVEGPLTGAQALEPLGEVISSAVLTRTSPDNITHLRSETGFHTYPQALIAIDDYAYQVLYDIMTLTAAKGDIGYSDLDSRTRELRSNDPVHGGMDLGDQATREDILKALLERYPVYISAADPNLKIEAARKELLTSQLNAVRLDRIDIWKITG